LAVLGSDQDGFNGIISGSMDDEANLNSPLAAAITAMSTADATVSRTKVCTNIQITFEEEERGFNLRFCGLYFYSVNDTEYILIF